MKSNIKDGRCINTGKVAYSEMQANKLADKWKPDERGSWSAYKCLYGKRHWHVGHKVIEPTTNQHKGEE